MSRRREIPRSSKFRGEFDQALDRHFPDALHQGEYIAETVQVLSRFGFTKTNCLACAAACRDEIAAPLLSDVEAKWGVPFSLVSLAGMLTAGSTGLGAAVHHAPIESGKRRLVCYAMPHIAISSDGTVGQVQRPGVPTPSRACGALHALQNTLATDNTDTGFDRLDVEQSLLATRLGPAIERNTVPDLLDLVHLAAQAIEDDLWELFHHAVGKQPDPASVDAALFTAVQIHGPGNVNYVSPRSGYVLSSGNLYVIDHDSQTANPEPGPGPGPAKPSQTGRATARKWLARGAAATAAAVLLNARHELNRT